VESHFDLWGWIGICGACRLPSGSRKLILIFRDFSETSPLGPEFLGPKKELPVLTSFLLYKNGQESVLSDRFYSFFIT
jgi:hypothetical protein